MLYYRSETIIGQANKTVYGKGLTSTEAEKKKLKGLYIITSGRSDNYVEVWKESERIAEINDMLLPLASDNPKQMVEIDVDIPVGQSVAPALRCGGTATTIRVVYVYEIGG